MTTLIEILMAASHSATVGKCRLIPLGLSYVNAVSVYSTDSSSDSELDSGDCDGGLWLWGLGGGIDERGSL